MAKTKALPNTIYVCWEFPGNGKDDPWLTTAESIEGVMDGDGPETVGVYQLVETKRAEKVLKVQ